MNATLTQNISNNQRNNDLLTKILSELVNHQSVRFYKDESGELKVELEMEQKKQDYDIEDKEYLDSRQAAELIHHSVYWLCRKINREKYGIKLYKIGGKNLFKKKEIMAVVEKNLQKKQGRPRKLIFVENLESKLV